MIRRAVTVILAAAALVVGCGKGFTPTRVVTGGAPDVGERVIEVKGCGGCHTIPGVKRADGLVGPPLIKFGRRSVIAGQLKNTPDNLIRWLQDPKGIEPGTDMPDLGLTDQEARDIAAYLEGLG